MEQFMLGMSGCGRALNDEEFESYAKNNIGAMEISHGGEALDRLDWKDVQRKAEKYGVELWSLHLPFLPFSTLDPASLNKEKREYTVKYQSEYIKKAGEIGIKTFVVHPSAEPYLEEEREEILKCSSESMSKLADVAVQFGGSIAVENLPRTCMGRGSYDMLKILSYDDRLRACFDTNHLFTEKVSDFVKKLGNKIITTHISDFDYKNERHWLPGEGKVDFLGIIESLKSVDYQGPWLYELGYTHANTIERRILRPDDFYENYKTLMSGVIPAPVGTPNEENCTDWKDM